MKLLDTSVAVDYLRGHVAAAELLDSIVIADEPLAASELTRFELLAGARDGEYEQLESFCLALDWIPVNEEIARRAGGYARSYHRSHSGIGVVDYLLAGTAAALGADLLTTNVRHFPMFGELRAPYSYAT